MDSSPVEQPSRRPRPPSAGGDRKSNRTNDRVQASVDRPQNPMLHPNQSDSLVLENPIRQFETSSPSSLHSNGDKSAVRYDKSEASADSSPYQRGLGPNHLGESSEEPFSEAENFPSPKFGGLDDTQFGETSQSLLAPGQLSTDMKTLLEFIETFTPENIVLDYRLQPFLPDYIPSIGDIDPMIKVPVPSKINGISTQTLIPKHAHLGCDVLDEPNICQSDPAGRFQVT